MSGAAVLKLPLASWAARFGHGAAVVRGRLPEALPLPDGAPLPAGPTLLWCAFRGGAAPTVTAARAGERPLDGAGVRAVLDALHDASWKVDAELADAVTFPLALGAMVSVPAKTVFVVRGTTTGSASHPRLSASVEAEVTGAGLVVGDRLSALPALHIHHVSLAPDGEVLLATRAEGTLGRMANSGLRPIARQLTELVRTSPRLVELRTWLVSSD